MSSLRKIQKEKPTKSDLIKYETNRINMITNESLEDLDVIRTHEMKTLEEINFKLVMLEGIKKNLEEFEMNNILETELKGRIEILQEEKDEVRKILKVKSCKMKKH